MVTAVRRFFTPLKVLWVVSLLILGGSVFFWYNQTRPLLSPLTQQASRFISGSVLSSSSTQKIVYGFLPYWNVDNVTLQPELTHLSYFGLTIAADGSLVTRESTYGEPGYTKYHSNSFQDVLQSHDGKLELTFTQFDNDDIVAFLSSPLAHQRFLQSLDTILQSSTASGINIDIEYSGEVTDALRNNFVDFMQTLDTHVDQKRPGTQISIDMYASAASKRTAWDVARIAPHVDYIVVMAYDFHQRSSTVAGPVAPLFGGKDLWDNDIAEFLQTYLEVVPPEKILLGVPFYGYEWQTETRDAQAHTFPRTGSTASFKRVQELLAQSEELEVEEQWNDQALSPYLSYTEDGQIFVVYYENSRSMSYKLDLVHQLDLAGVAIWALGYEGNSRELWDVVQRKVSL